MRSQKRHLLEALAFIGACIALVAFVVPYLPGASTSLDPSARASAKLGIDVDSVMKKEEQVGRGSIKPENSKKYPFIRSDRAYPGFTLFPEVGSSKVKLLNMAGEVVHEWPFDADRIRLLPNGNVLVVHGSKWGAGVRRWRKLNNVVREYDWDGELVWEYKVPSRVHHDVQLLSNGNILGVQRLDLPASMSAELENPLLRNREIRSDEIFEVNRERKWFGLGSRMNISIETRVGSISVQRRWLKRRLKVINPTIGLISTRCQSFLRTLGMNREIHVFGLAT